MNEEDLDIVKLGALVSLKKTPNELGEILHFSDNEIKNLLFHTSTYVGCPKVWDASMQVSSINKPAIKKSGSAE